MRNAELRTDKRECTTTTQDSGLEVLNHPTSQYFVTPTMSSYYTVTSLVGGDSPGSYSPDIYYMASDGESIPKLQLDANG